MRIFGDERDADLIISNGRNVDLAAVAPVNLDVIDPGFQSEVLAEAVAAQVGAHTADLHAFANLRGLAVGADDPAAGGCVVVKRDAIVLDAGDACAPAKFNAHFFRALGEEIVENRATN